jgi:iron complex outermembrane receptor protein
MNKFLQRILPVLFVIFAMTAALGQTGTVSGVVKDKSTGETMPGANVIIKGTLIGAVTNFDGLFVIENVPAGEVQVDASFIGYIVQTIKTSVSAGKTTTLDFNLESDAVALEETVVIGYGIQKKSDRTGAVSNITSDELNKGVLTDPVQGIQGKIAGVSVTKKGGDP